MITMFLFHTKYTEVLKALCNRKLGKSLGYDVISAEILRSCYDVVTILILMINKSIEEENFSELRNPAKVTPLHEKGGKTDTEIYRSISVLSVINEIFERNIYERRFFFQ